MISNSKNTIFILKTKISFKRWATEILALFLLESLSPLINHSRKKYLAVMANDHITNHITSRGFYEEGEMSIVKNLLSKIHKTNKNYTFIDIGANLGNHSVYFSDIFSEIHAFEPNPIIFKVLNANSELNNKIKTYNVGLGDEETTELLKINESNAGASHVRKYYQNSFPKFQTNQDDIEIRITKLDNYIDSFENLSYIKLDIEGMEYLALKGAEEIIKRFKPIIQFELLQQDVPRPEIINFLEKYNYSIYQIININDLRSNFHRRIYNLLELLRNKKIISYQIRRINSFENKTHNLIAMQTSHVNCLN
tara:strand:+ start:214 stop:1140 length:927 start_codon:yes stop_codon:yes gene_type:complete